MNNTHEPIIFRNGLLVDGSGPEAIGPVDVRIADGKITAVSSERIQPDGAIEYDVAGKTIMPGLIDCHMHPFLTDMNLMKLADTPVSLVTAQASVVLNRLLDRGFTTIRDAAGGDWGFAAGSQRWADSRPAAVYFRQGTEPDRRPR